MKKVSVALVAASVSALTHAAEESEKINIESSSLDTDVVDSLLDSKVFEDDSTSYDLFQSIENLAASVTVDGESSISEESLAEFNVARSSDSTSYSAGRYSPRCYTNCHSACHGSRSWR